MGRHLGENEEPILSCTSQSQLVLTSVLMVICIVGLQQYGQGQDLADSEHGQL